MSVLISIIIPCRNEARHIGDCLASVLSQQAVDGGFEVIVADGLSDDGTRAILTGLAERDGRLRVFDNPGRIVSTGLNAAIRSALGEIIIRMDAHTEYAPDYVRECVAVLEATGADNVGGPMRTKAEGYMSRAICAANGSRFAAGGTRSHDTSYEGEFDTVIYGCWRKEFLLKTGLFNEELVRNQDDELNLRITRAGGRLWQSPRIRCWYRPRSSLGALGRQYFQYGYWKVRVIQLHRRIASPRHVVPVLFTMGVSLGWLAGFAHPSLWGAYAGMLALYASASLVFAVRAARVHGWDLLPALPLVFLTFHLGYGGGFARGVWDFVIRGAMRASRRPTSRVARPRLVPDSSNVLSPLRPPEGAPHSPASSSPVRHR
jgi:succinoglycan biosynthesis protein ExoA